MQPTRRWILGAAGLLVAAPSIVRASSLMAMPRAPVWMPKPGQLVAELFDFDGNLLDRLPAEVVKPSALGEVDVFFKMLKTATVHEVRLTRDYRDLLIYRAATLPVCRGDTGKLSITSFGGGDARLFNYSLSRDLVAESLFRTLGGEAVSEDGIRLLTVGGG